MIKSITKFIDRIEGDLELWGAGVKPWFRGESGEKPHLRPKIACYNLSQENHLMQSFRRHAGGLSNVPSREDTDLWLFLAQHYGVPTRLLDWTEGALHALYFAINQGKPKPSVYMLNPRKLNHLATSITNPPNYPLSSHKSGALYVALAWQNRSLSPKQVKEMRAIGLDLIVPLAFPATYQDQRMIAQRSCFTIHGSALDPMQDIIRDKNVNLNNYLFEYKIDEAERDNLLRQLSILGVSAATVFPDLDHLAEDLKFDVKTFSDNQE